MANTAKKILSDNVDPLDGHNSMFHIAPAGSHLEHLHNDTRGFDLLSQLLKQFTGIHLPPTAKNFSLMAARVSNVLDDLRLKKYRDLYERIQAGDDDARWKFIFSMTTNTTQFFRESQHFDFLRKWLPDLAAEKNKAYSSDIRVWCAAASTGQEPYTIGMVLLEQFDISKWNIKFLSTDIDVDVLKKASNGIYSEPEIQSLPLSYRQKYFSAHGGKPNVQYKVLPPLSQLIRFAQLNLIQPEYPFQHQFDIIFCRNVLIYFDSQTTAGVIDRMIKALRPGGLLFLGHSESGAMKSKQVKQVLHAVYQKIG